MSNLLEQASLVLIPSGYAEDIVYSEIPLDGSGDMVFSRSSNGTRINSAGLVEVCPWNLWAGSNDFSATYWSQYQLTPTTGTTSDIYGNSSTVYKLIGSVTNSYSFINRSSNGSANTAFSLYAKPNGYTKIGISNRSVGAWNFVVDLVTKVVSNIDDSTSTIVSINVVDAVGDWKRIELVVSTAVQYNLHPLPSNFNSTNFDNVTLNGTDGVWVMASQVNIGSTAKPYFPTTDRLNVPRLTYQNGGGGCPSLLLEKQSTNLFTYSEQFDNADWTKLNTTVSANSTTSPDGTQNADTLTPTTTNGVHRIQQDKATASQVFTQSIFAKANGYNFIALENGGEVAYFNISTGVVGTVSAGTASIQNMGNGWYRCIFTATASNAKSYFYVANADNSPSFAGDATSGIFVWGAQFEASSYATSYISTTSASATRVADVCTKTGIGALIGGTSGTVFFDIKTNPTLSSANYKQFCYYFTSGGSQSYMFLDGANKIQTNSNWGSLFYNTAFQPNTRYKVALVFAPNDFALYVNGVSVATASSGTPNNNADITIGQLAGGENCEFVFNQYTHFQSRLTNAELAALTTL